MSNVSGFYRWIMASGCLKTTIIVERSNQRAMSRQ